MHLHAFCNQIDKGRGQISPKVFLQKNSAILGIFGNIGTFGDAGTEIKFFVDKLKPCKRAKWRHNLKCSSVLERFQKLYQMKWIFKMSTPPNANKQKLKKLNLVNSIIKNDVIYDAPNVFETKIILARCWECHGHNCEFRNDSYESNRTIVN